MHRCFLWERKLALIGGHRFLCNKVHELKIRGYGRLHYGHPANPFQPPSPHISRWHQRPFSSPILPPSSLYCAISKLRSQRTR